MARVRRAMRKPDDKALLNRCQDRVRRAGFMSMTAWWRLVMNAYVDGSITLNPPSIVDRDPGDEHETITG